MHVCLVRRMALSTLSEGVGIRVKNNVADHQAKLQLPQCLQSCLRLLRYSDDVGLKIN